MLSKAIKLAKGSEEPKVGLSVQVPKSLKDEFESICKENSVSMSSMLLSLIQVAVEESKYSEPNVMEMNKELNKLKRTRRSLEETIDKTGDTEIEDVNGVIHYLDRDLKSVKLQIKTLEVELENILGREI